MFKPFKRCAQFKPSRLSSPASRGRMKEGEHSWRAWRLCGRHSDLCELCVFVVSQLAKRRSKNAHRKRNRDRSCLEGASAFTEHERLYQLKFQSGEQALLLAADMPASSVELVRLGLAARGEIHISQSLLIAGCAVIFVI